MQAGTDLELVEASRRGDRDAFAQIIERYHRAVYAVAFSGSCDRSLADDLTQDTFVTAWRRLDDLRDGQRLPAWLCGIARNLARDARKRRFREHAGEPDDAVLVDANTPYEAMSEAESERVVATALGQVPDLYREPLVLYYYEERSIEDVARSLGISGATTNKRISRGRRYLAERVATIVERGLPRRGPNAAAVAASVLAIIGITLPASHVDASPVSKGSTMHKLAIAATVLAAATASGIVLSSDSRPSDAHASAAATPAVADLTAQPAQGARSAHRNAAIDPHTPPLTKMFGALRKPVASPIVASAANDCSAVGRHLQELEADTTHGGDDRPDEAFCEKCVAHYKGMCESEGWSLERRVCTLAAGDLINAHLCAAGNVAAADPTAIPANLACSVLAPHLASMAKAAGFYAEVPDFQQQIEAACDAGKWPLALRRCFSTGKSMEALAACMHDMQASN